MYGPPFFDAYSLDISSGSSESPLPPKHSCEAVAEELTDREAVKVVRVKVGFFQGERVALSLRGAKLRAQPAP